MHYRTTSSISAVRLMSVEHNARNIICYLPEQSLVQVLGPCSVLPGMLEVKCAGTIFAVFSQDLDARAVLESEDEMSA